MGQLYDWTVGRAFTAWYGRVMRRIDERGLRDVRRRLLAGVSGKVLDLGTGTGSNLELFPASVGELVLSEPSPSMARALTGELRRQGRPNTEVVQALAEALPFGPATFDYVTCTMVICTMPDPQAGLREAARVLKPGGKFLFLEHVRSEDHRVVTVQDRLERPWRFIAAGCHCDRDSLATIEASPLALESLTRDLMPLAPQFMTPLIVGSATR